MSNFDLTLPPVVMHEVTSEYGSAESSPNTTFVEKPVTGGILVMDYVCNGLNLLTKEAVNTLSKLFKIRQP